LAGIIGCVTVGHYGGGIIGHRWLLAIDHNIGLLRHWLATGYACANTVIRIIVNTVYAIGHWHNTLIILRPLVGHTALAIARHFSWHWH